METRTFYTWHVFEKNDLNSHTSLQILVSFYLQFKIPYKIKVNNSICLNIVDNVHDSNKAIKSPDR